MALDAYGPDSEGQRGKADARQRSAISTREAEDRRHFLERHRLGRDPRGTIAEARVKVHAELAAAQAILASLDAGDISPKLASQQIQRHLAKAKQLLGGAG